MKNPYDYIDFTEYQMKLLFITIASETSALFGNPKRPINVIKKILPQNYLVLITLELSHYLRFHFIETLQISF